jgi:hypothetical protein
MVGGMSEVFDPAGLQMLLGDTEYSLTRGGPEEGDRDRGSQRSGRRGWSKLDEWLRPGAPSRSWRSSKTD